MAGFNRPTTTQTPDALFDHWLARLTGAELRVLLYAVRRTFGFRKDHDAISRDQFLHGIRTKDGRVLDEGTGIGSGTTLSNAINRLIEHGLLIREKRSTPRTGDQVSLYRTNISEEPLTRPDVGFQPVNTTQVPDDLFDYWLPRVGDAELRVLLYIIRRTLGFRRQADDIAFSHFMHGMISREGRVLDEGCGVRSEKAIYRAIRQLKEYGLITAEQRRSDERGYLWTRYAVLFADELPRLLHPDDRIGMGQQRSYNEPLTPPFPSLGGESDLNRQGVHSEQDGGPIGTVSGIQFNQVGAPILPATGIHFDQVGGPVATSRPPHDDPRRALKAQDKQGVDGDKGGPVTAGRGSQSEQVGHPPGADSRPGAPVLHGLTTVDTQQTVDQEAVSQQTEFSPKTEKQQQKIVVVLNSDEEISSYPLGAGEVLIETEDGNAQVVPLQTLVQMDIEATHRNYGLHIATDCYYSADQFLGIGGDEWTPDEERKRQFHLTLRREMEGLYNDVGAFSVDDGLAQYFTADLVARFHADSPEEQQRQRGWLCYIRSEAGQNLQNPAGFLRTRLESGQWPPRGAARGRSRKR